MVARKKLISILFIAAVLFGVLAVSVSAAGTIQPAGDPLTYTVLSETTVAVTDCEAGKTSVTIPASVQGYQVTQLKDGLFNGYTSLETLTFADGCKLESIKNAFNGCTGLKTVNWGDSSQSSLREITKAFQGCTALQTLTIPANVQTIGEKAFANCISLTTLTFENNSQCKVIGTEAFAYTGKDDVTVPATITSLRLPASLETLAEGAFHCVPVKAFSLENNSSLAEIPNGFLAADGQEGKPGLYTQLTHLFQWVDNVFKVINLPEPFEFTPSQVAAACASLVSIDLGDYNSLTQIGDGAFKNQIYLTSIDFGENSRSAGLCIGYNAFAAAGNNGYRVDKSIDAEMNEGIDTLVFPANLVTLRDNSFRLARVRNLVFQKDCKLTEIPDGFLRVEGGDGTPDTEKVYVGANALKTIDFGENNALTLIDRNAFKNQSYLTNIDFGTSAAAELVIEDSAFMGAGNNGYYVDQSVDSELSEGIDTLAFPANLKSLVNLTFKYARVKNIVFADGCKLAAIPENFLRVEGGDGTPSTEKKFVGTNALETVDFGESNSLALIGRHAFRDQSHLTNIDFGTSATAELVIENGAFLGVGNNGNYVKLSVDSELSEGIDTLVFPANLKSLDNLAFNYARIKNIVFADGCKLAEIPENFMRVEGGDGKPSIDKEYVGSNALETVDFGENNSLALIGRHAFRNQSHLTNIDFGTSATAELVIEDGAFLGAGNNANFVELSVDSELSEGIDTLVFPANLKSIVGLAFKYARIKNIVFADGCKLAEIPDNFMRVEGGDGKPSVDKEYVRANALETVDFGENNSLALIDRHAFRNQSHLTNIDFGTSATAELVIEDGAFLGAGNNANFVEQRVDSELSEGIDTLVFPANLKSIVGLAFKYARVKNIVFADGCKLAEIPDNFMRVEGGDGTPSTDMEYVRANALETVDFGENNSLTLIDRHAFRNQSYLTNIDFGTSAAAELVIKGGAFLGVGNNGYYVAQNIDSELSEGIDTLVFPANLKSLDYLVLKYARVKNIVFADGCKLTEIPDSFMRIEGGDGTPDPEMQYVRANALETVDFGENNSLTLIDYYAFRNQSHLTEIDFGTSTAELTLNDGAFMGAGNNASLVAQSIDEELCDGIDTLEFPVNLTCLKNLCFKYACVKNIVFPDNCKITSIGTGFMEIGGEDGVPSTDVAFAASNCLRSVEFGENTKLAKIGCASFHNQTNLTRIDFGSQEDGVTLTLACGTFAGTSPRTLTLPANIAFDGNGQFKKAKVTRLIFADNFKLTTLPDGFLTKDYDDPTDQPVLESIDFGTNNALTSIGAGMFAGNSNLKTLDLTGTKVKTIEKGAFNECGLTKIILPDTVTTVNEGAFQGLNGTETLVLGSEFQVSKLEGGVLSKSDKLVSLDMYNSGITVISDAIKENPNLEKVIFPESLQSITWNDGERSLKVPNVETCPFYGCTNLSELYFSKLDPSEYTFSEGVFQFFSKTGTIYVPAGTTEANLQAYKTKLVDAGMPIEESGCSIERYYSVTALKLDQKTAYMTVGESFILNASVFPENVTNKDIVWASSNPAVASVDENGKVTAHFYGTAVITVTSLDNGKTASATIVVNGIPDNGSYVPDYRVDVAQSAHGTVIATPNKAASGDTVTLYVTADEGYTLETITVKRAGGDSIPVKPVTYGETYTFTMPSARVEVKATFMEDNSVLNSFLDVSKDAYYYKAVVWATGNGYAAGTDASHFSPNAPITRGEMVAILWRASGSPEPKAKTTVFTDVKKTSDCYKAVIWATEQGYVNGTSDTTFSPDAIVTRAQAVTILARMNGVEDFQLGYPHPFTDVKKSDYFSNAVAWAVANGITDGTTDTTFSPHDTCLRAHIITFVWRSMVK